MLVPSLDRRFVEPVVVTTVVLAKVLVKHCHVFGLIFDCEAKLVGARILYELLTVFRQRTLRLQVGLDFRDVSLRFQLLIHKTKRWLVRLSLRFFLKLGVVTHFARRICIWFDFVDSHDWRSLVLR